MSDDAAILHAQQIRAASATRAMLHAMMNDRANYVDQMKEQQVRDGHLRGFVPMPAAGECTVQIDFPMIFLEKPLFTFGLELDANQSTAYGSFPIASATVMNWITRLAPGDRLTYVGARLGIVVVGPATIKTILHYSFAGQTFTDPTGTNTSVTGKI